MNENHENNTNESLDEREPLTKRVAKFSAFIYLGLAITVVIVATVGIFSISYDYETDIPSVSIPDFVPDVSIPQDVIAPPVTDKPVGNEQSGVDAGINEPEDPTPVFFRPTNGEIVKKHDLSKLVFSETMQDYRVHSGIDISCESGSGVVAFTDGVITSVTDDYFYGTTIVISHEQGVTSSYMNLSEDLAENITVGTEVKAGQLLGYVGNTARIESKDAPHLHFELYVDGAPIDPEPELP